MQSAKLLPHQLDLQQHLYQFELHDLQVLDLHMSDKYLPLNLTHQHWLEVIQLPLIDEDVCVFALQDHQLIFW